MFDNFQVCQTQDRIVNQIMKLVMLKKIVISTRRKIKKSFFKTFTAISIGVVKREEKI